jgi:hypothetical protein
MTVPTLENTVGLDTSDHTTIGRVMGMQGAEEGDDDQALYLEDRMLIEFKQLADTATEQSGQHISNGLRVAWARAYEAYGNRHSSGSKYRSQQFIGRSKLFRPKTRIAVRKKLKEAANALFSTGDVVSVEATNDSDQMQTASAALKAELMNYRLRHTSRRIGIRWFQLALGALETAQIAGMIVSKQAWHYTEEPIDKAEIRPGVHPHTGEPMHTLTDEPRILQDRPGITLYPPENVILDPNADWTDPAQTAQYVGLRNFMSPSDAWQMVKAGIDGGSKIPWLADLTLSVFEGQASSTGPSDTAGTRVARDGKVDPLSQATGAFKRVCLVEWFMRRNGREYVFWTLDRGIMLSDPVRVREAYPEQDGTRPIVCGVGAIEAFKVHPMSPVESWQPLQQEINDSVNLRLDHMKQIVSPPSKVKRGKKVDLAAVQGRGPNRIIMVDEMDDVENMTMQDTPQGAFVENNYLNADMDDLTGTLNTGTVQTNNQLNETVGGLSLMANDSNSMSEFDLSVWVETWVTPVLTQILKLEEYYEDDATILALCGEKAKLFQRFGMDQVTDFLLTSETQLSIKAGIGAASHPAQRVQKFAASAQVAMAVLEPFVREHVIQTPVPKAKEIIDMVFGGAGFQNAADRFFHPIDDNAPPPPPPQPQVDPSKQAELQVKSQLGQQSAALKQQELAVRTQEGQQKLADNEVTRQQKLQSDHMRALTEIGGKIMDRKRDQERAAIEMQHDRTKQAIDHQNQGDRANSDNFHSLLKSKIDKDAQMQQTAMGHAAAAGQAVFKHHSDMALEKARAANRPTPGGSE